MKLILCARVKRYKAAWRRLRLREEIVSGERFYLAGRDWLPTDCWELAVSYAPILYF